MAYKIIITDWQTDQNSLRNIRERVFIHEQQVPIADEWDGKDEAAVHFLALTFQDEAVACARLLVENRIRRTILHIGRVAVLAEHRNQGIGHQLMQNLVSYCAQQYPGCQIYLNAQVSRRAFYENLDFIAKGEIFMDAGIPHIEMWHLPLEVALNHE